MTDATFPGTDWGNTALDTPEPEVDQIDEIEVEETKPKKTPAKKAPARRAPVRKTARGKAVDRKTVASIVEKTLAVQGTDDRDLLASVLGVEDDVTEIVTAIVSGGAKIEGVSDAVELSEIDDETERGVSAALLGAKLKPVWAVYHALNLVPRDAPEGTSKAAIALSKAAAEFAEDDVARARLDGVIEITQ